MSAGASAVAASNDERRAARRRAALAVIVLLALVGALVLAAPAHASLPRLETIARPELGDALSVERLDDLTDDVGSLDAAPDVPDPPLPLLEPLPRTDYGELFARELVLVGDLVQASAQASVSAYDGIASLPETRVWASSVFAPDSRPGFNRVSAETATGFGLGLAGDRVGRTHEGAWTDPVTGLAYHRARWYDPHTASWLSEDPMEDWDSVNRYAFVGLAPHLFADPRGLGAEEIAKGTAGEAALVRRLREQGWQVFFGGVDHPTTARGADAFAYNPNTDELAFFDDKNWDRPSISRVSALDKNFKTGPSIRRAQEAIRASNMETEMKVRLLDRLEETPEVASRYSKYVTAAAEESKVVRVTERVERKGIRFLDVKGARGVAGKAGPLLAIVSILLAEDPSYALGDALNPFGVLGIGQNTPDTDAEIRGIYEYELFPALAKELERRTSSSPSPATTVVAPTNQGRSGP